MQIVSRNKYQFSNWAGNVRCRVNNFYQPHSAAEIKELVSISPKIRLAGSGHSWSPVCKTTETLVNLDNYNKVLSLDKENNHLKVQAGIKLHQINEFLDANGLALSNLGSISNQSVAGAISTGTHGSGIKFELLASQIEEFTLISADGKEIAINSKHDKELFNHAIINLGALGIISEITLNVVPAFRLHEKSFVAHFDEVIFKLDEYLEYHDHFKIWWFPPIEECLVFCYNRTYDAPNDSHLRAWLMDDLIAVGAYRFLLHLGNLNRKWRKNINWFLVNKLVSPLDRIEKSYKIFNVPAPPVHRETEWAFDVKDAKKIIEEFKLMIKTTGHPINFLQEIRFSKADKFSLSPAYGRNTLWLGCYNADNFNWHNLLKDFELFAKSINGRPHWGKEFTINREYLSANYPEFSHFNELRQKLDPEKKFCNEYIDEIFG